MAELTLGSKLRATRESKGISILEAAEKTRFLPQMLTEMEADDFSRISAPIYAKGFIRGYAKFLELDPNPLIDEYFARTELGEQKPKTLVERKKATIRYSTPSFMKRNNPNGKVSHRSSGWTFDQVSDWVKGKVSLKWALIGCGSLLALIVLGGLVSTLLNRPEPSAPISALTIDQELIAPPLDVYLTQPNEVKIK